MDTFDKLMALTLLGLAIACAFIGAAVFLSTLAAFTR